MIHLMRYEISGHFILRIHLQKSEIFNCILFGEAVTLLGKNYHVKLGLIFLFFFLFFSEACAPEWVCRNGGGYASDNVWCHGEE